MLLGVHPGNVRARRFYEKKGFSVIGQRRFQVGQSVFEDPVYGRAL
jgi:ribosomal protein S18 acetylase RimI-like enzyme